MKEKTATAAINNGNNAKRNFQCFHSIWDRLTWLMGQMINPFYSFRIYHINMTCMNGLIVWCAKRHEVFARTGDMRAIVEPLTINLLVQSIRYLWDALSNILFKWLTNICFGKSMRKTFTQEKGFSLWYNSRIFNTNDKHTRPLHHHGSTPTSIGAYQDFLVRRSRWRSSESWRWENNKAKLPSAPFLSSAKYVVDASKMLTVLRCPCLFPNN